MKSQTNIIIALLLVMVLKINAQNNESEFKKLNYSKQWHLVLNYKCTKDWTKNWFLDGLIASVKNTKQGMLFSAGSEVRNDAHHACFGQKSRTLVM